MKNGILRDDEGYDLIVNGSTAPSATVRPGPTNAPGT
jgi:hypothetical protein